MSARTLSLDWEFHSTASACRAWYSPRWPGRMADRLITLWGRTYA